MTGSLGVALADLAQNLDAVAVGQSEIEQHQVEGMLGHSRQPFAAVVGGLDLVAFKLQQSLQRFADGGFVVDDQHRRRRDEFCRARPGATG